MKDIVAELARRLVEIPSETGKEKEIGDMIAERLSQRFDIQKQKVKPKRFNILATKGTPNLIFNIHLDTVPGHIPIRIEDNHLWGRGSVDAKGPLAALIIAAEKASDQGITDFAIMLDVGEEVDLCGIKKLIPELDDANLIIVCEPTNMKLRVAQKGTAKIKIKTKGKAAHSAYPHLGIDANEKLLDALNTIRSLPLGNDKKLGPTTINVGVLKGGTAANVISDQAEAFLSIRITPGDEDIVDRIQDALKDQDGIEIIVIMKYDPYSFDDHKKIDEFKAILKKEKIPTKVVTRPGFTTMFFWSKLGPTIVVGPGDESLQHGMDEHINLDQLEMGVRFYLAVMKKYGTTK